MANILQHLAERGTMAFVDNEYDAFASELLHFLFGDMPSPALMLLIFWMEVTMSVSLGRCLPVSI